MFLSLELLKLTKPLFIAKSPPIIGLFNEPLIFKFESIKKLIFLDFILNLLDTSLRPFLFKIFLSMKGREPLTFISPESSSNALKFLTSR